MAKGDVLVRMKADVGNYNANLANARRTLQNFKEENLSLGGVVKNMTRSFTGYAAGLMSIGAVAGKLHETVTEAVALAKAGEGIRNSFSRLNDPNLLKGLREATHGTVADVELMKAAVKFDDFKLPVSELGTMLAFAQQKAKDTGQSVDYMVDSIVTGLGRKSLMILDNLGLSATEVKEKMKETGDMTKAVGEIIREQMSKSGDYVETAAERATKADVDLKNAMDDLGRTLMPLQEAGVSMFNSWQIAAVKFLNSALKPVIEAFTTIGRMNKAYGMMGGDSAVNAQIQALAGSGNQRETYFRQMGAYRATNQGLNRAIGAIQAWQGGDHSDAARRAMENAKQTYGLTSLNTAPLRAALDANTKMMEEYKKKALAILEPVNEAIANPGATDISGKGGGKTKPSITPDPAVEGSLKDLNNQIKELRDAQANVTNAAEWQNFQAQIDAVANRIKGLKGELAAIGVGGLAKAEGVSITGSITDSVKQEGTNLKTADLSKPIANLKVGKDLAKQGEQARQAWSLAAQAVSSVGDAFNSIEDPGVKAMGTITQAIASIALGFATASVQAGALGPFGWVAFLAAGAAALATTISTVHSLTNLSEGGFVPGRSFSGDNIKANGGALGLNAGELVLNTSQQNNLANALQNNRNDYAESRPYVTGEMIYLALNNYMRRSGHGEILKVR